MFGLTVNFSSVRNLTRCIVLSFITILVLIGCSGQDRIVHCPSIRVPEDTGVLTRFIEGSDGDITDVQLEARFSFARGTCTIDEDLVEIEALLEIGVREGPASTSSIGQVSIFVAVSGQNREILQRRSLPISVDFSGNRSTILHRERLIIEIPKTIEQRGDEFVIFTGFEMTREEVRFNRATQ